MRDTNHSLFFDRPSVACGRLITRAFAFHKRPLIETMFSGRDGGDAIRCLLGDDPQTFIDVIDEARSTVSVDLLIEINIDMFVN